ncbi:hypothetical protein F9C07_10479 [Aspergillus flavus]|uniref:Uncharacterized protein n=1 Tax=Aspergillus flavus (strain ATCC 200026 / FGSC A1120 / IAM 13836 / NRRL 3357 / JCM 12722 / SRRC 167) TaxID=332952 RepID=A0A7U2QZL3_ASPFN|nr:hypothetical protein F9C07_10479 [Aspergillus flavus]
MIEKIASHQVTQIALRDRGCKLRQIMSGEKKPAFMTNQRPARSSPCSSSKRMHACE